MAITRTDLSAGDLRAQARRAKDGDQACRLVALAFVLEGIVTLTGFAIKLRQLSSMVLKKFQSLTKL